jgi:hypothetical protein
MSEVILWFGSSRVSRPASVLSRIYLFVLLKLEFMDTFWENLGKSAESIKKELGMIALDGTNYEVRVTASLASLTYIVRDEEASEVVTGQGVIRWLNVIRLDMEKRLPK